MTATQALTTDLQKQVLLLEDDLRDRVEGDVDLKASWQAEHRQALTHQRTSSSWQAWRDDRVTQAAVGWVLTTVFIRFCEDNELVRPVWISGPESRRQEALDAQLVYFRAHPEETDREWIGQAVTHLHSLPATRELVATHAAIHLVAPSGQAAERLLEFWRQRDDDNRPVHDFADPTLSTRFLGDLYQDLSAYAKATFALLQTPVFVEEFILDQTLEPALADRPLEGFRMIDPTCGSGHFLLGAFARLLDRWQKHAPAVERQALVQRALDAVNGIDLNPFAVAIARFRLTVAALQASGLTSLESAPAFDFHLAAGDSLLHGPGQSTLAGDTDLSDFVYETEDLQQLQTMLAGGRYDAVVGNPPYITVKDKVLNQAYRDRYESCKGTYAMTVPFMERFFTLAKSGLGDQPAGWVGQITSNSFMKREFGSKLIESFLVRQDLRLVADTSGAYIPGHGTPTVIIVGRHQRPVGQTVRAVLGVRGEPGRPDDPARGIVWTSIVEHVDEPGWDDSWITVTDLDRELLARHPWSLTGGGASTLMSTLAKRGDRALGELIRGKIGFASFPGADDCFFAPSASLVRDEVPAALIRPVILGEVVRDWNIAPVEAALVPYDMNAQLVPLDPDSSWARRQWRTRTVLKNVTGFGGETQADAGAAWWGWYRWVAERYRTPLSIAFAFVATHNHFVLDRGGKVFNRSAPVIKLPAGATEDDHLALLGVLNSSTACFWLKQNSHNKGSSVDTAGARQTQAPWENFFEFTGTTLQDFPLPGALSLDRGRILDDLARQLVTCSPESVARAQVSTVEVMSNASTQAAHLHARMVAVQEELDWEVYRLYGLIDEDLTYSGNDLPGVALGERAFEIVLARQIAAGEEESAWFSRHGSTPITELPAHWPSAYRDLVQRRLDLIASNPAIGLLERPEYKRRWATEPWEKRQERALRGWLLDRLEDRRFWFDAQDRPAPRSVAQLADDVARDPDLVSVLALWEGRPDVPVTQSLVKLLADEAVPYLAAYRYKDSGLRKREVWEQTWALQRREDAGESVGPIPVPPKYTSADFRSTPVWQARGKLDVPKERFVAYPNAGRDTDPTPLLGWAGWDHAQQSLALSVIIGNRENEGWSDERLVPLVAGLAELQPWVEQWHADLDATYGVSLAAFCREQLERRAGQVGMTLDELAAWRPPPTTRGRGRKKGSPA